ncbi:MAG: hydrogenase maturation nickel metallochaperone HypA, partial [Oscillospiraceae bacterium]|nr:hydrogenase maturation nickel metallochaperone HypA [Oscillospiraceae bacterium]
YKTFMEKTRLELEVIPGIVRCKDCGKEFNAMAHDLACPCCGSREMEILSGNDFMIKELVCR